MKERVAGGGEDHTWYDPRLGGWQLQRTQQETFAVFASINKIRKKVLRRTTFGEVTKETHEGRLSL